MENALHSPVSLTLCNISFYNIKGHRNSMVAVPCCYVFYFIFIFWYITELLPLNFTLAHCLYDEGQIP